MNIRGRLLPCLSYPLICFFSSQFRKLRHASSTILNRSTAIQLLDASCSPFHLFPARRSIAVLQDKSYPLATLLGAAMLLKYGLGEEKAAQRIEYAVLDALNRGFRTGDIYSKGNKLVGCKEMGEVVLNFIEQLVPVAAV